MTIRELANYLQAQPDQDAHVAFAEWHNDGWHFITPPNLPHTDRPITFERFGLSFQAILTWDNCNAHKIGERFLEHESTLAKAK